MIIKVHMLAFLNGEIREVEVPNGEISLEKVFYYGQNDFQPKNYPSVSAGDVIELNNKFHLIKMMGFKELSKEEFEKYKLTDRIERIFGNG